MSLKAMLLPVFAQLTLTFVLLFWMSYLRIQAIRHGQVDPTKVSLREPNWPPRATQVGNAFQNQLETPLLFYVLTLLALITETADSILWVLSWMFVLARMLDQKVTGPGVALAFGPGLAAEGFHFGPAS